MSELGLIGLRQFRERLETLEEPIQVVKTRGKVTVLGTWIPRSSEMEWSENEDGMTIRIGRKVSSKR